MTRWIALGFLAAAGAAPLLAASAPPSAVVSAETDVVRVSISVTDKDGRAITDLRATDFVLLDDGRPQEILHFAAAAPPADASAAPDSAPAAKEEPRGRHIVLAVDDFHTSGPSLIRARQALRQFVERDLGPRDEVAIATTSGAGVTQAFTNDRAALVRAVEALQPNERRPDAAGRSSMTLAQADAIERNDSHALDLAAREIMATVGSPGQQAPWAEGEAKSQARQMVDQAAQFSNATFLFLEDLVRSLQRLPGRRLVILVSDGFMQAPPTEPAAFDLRRLIDASARADVPVYPLFARGVLSQTRGADALTVAVASSPEQHARYARLQDMAVLDTLSAVAEGTGGALVRGSNDLAAGLRHILADNASSYVAAYSASDELNGRFHKIEVKVPARPDLHIRARRGYFARREPTTTMGTAAALRALVPFRDIPIRMRTDFVDRGSEGLQLVVSAHVDANDVPFQRVGDRQRAELEFVRMVADERGRIVAPADGKTAALDLRPATYERTLAEGLGFRSDVPLAPGTYEVRLAVRETRSGKVGSARQWVDVPDMRKAGLSLSSVFLFAESPGAQDAAALRDIQGTRRYRRGGTLYYGTHVYNPARSETGAADVVTQTQILKGDSLQGASPVQPVPFDAKNAAHHVQGRIALEGLGPGDYELRVLAVDRHAGVQAERRIDFRIDFRIE